MSLNEIEYKIHRLSTTMIDVEFRFSQDSGMFVFWALALDLQRQHSGLSNKEGRSHVND